ncbi:MAG: DUF3592 domain-containing protein [Anaerolineales bacterium]
MSWFTVNNLLPLLFVGVGLILIYTYFRNLARVRDSAGWPTSQGTVVESRVRESTSQDQDGFTSTSYFPEVRYLYHVLGSEYEGNMITFGSQSGGAQNKVVEVINRYPTGSTVTVYYDPEKPSMAVLERSVSKGLLVSGVVCIAIGIFFFSKVL